MQRFRVHSGFVSAMISVMLCAGASCAAEPNRQIAALPIPVIKIMVVAADGTGDYKTVQEAIAALPDNKLERTVVHIKAGTYRGPFVVSKSKINVTFEGESPEKTILTYDKNVSDPRPEGAHIFNPGLDVLGNDFQAKNLTVQNTAGDRGPALAMHALAERVVFQNCRILGWQDTLLLDKGRYYFKDCFVAGRVDFIYGEGTSVFEKCEIHSKNGGYITAASTKQEKPFGFVFLNCKLTSDAAPWVDSATGQAKNRPDARTHLGRPWGPYAHVAFINCTMGDHIEPVAWNNWGNIENEKTARYVEYNSRTPDGKPVDVSKRVPWARQLNSDEALKYTLPNILGGAEGWNPQAGITSAVAKSHTASSRNATLLASAPSPATDVTTVILSRPTFVLAGDSTVTDNAGWGLGFKGFLKPNVTLVNLAKGGRASGSFYNEGSWKKALDLKPRYVLIQFGHNDEPGHGPDRETDPKTTYRANMERYVDEAKAAGIQPILVTPLSRRQWGVDGKIKSSLTPYAETVKQIAEEKHVPLLDLHALSIALYEKMGKEAVKEISPTKPGGFDGTHLNAKGGEMVGRLLAEAVGQIVPAVANKINLI